MYREVTRCNDNSRHLFSLSLLAFNRNQRLIIFSCSQDAITTGRTEEDFSMPFAHQEEEGACLVCMIVLFRIIYVHNGESFSTKHVVCDVYDEGILCLVVFDELKHLCFCVRA